MIPPQSSFTLQDLLPGLIQLKSSQWVVKFNAVYGQQLFQCSIDNVAERVIQPTRLISSLPFLNKNKNK